MHVGTHVDYPGLCGGFLDLVIAVVAQQTDLCRYSVTLATATERERCYHYQW